MAIKNLMKDITLSSVKKHLNIDDAFTEDDDYLVQLILVVLNLIIKRLNLKPQTEKEECTDGVYEINLCSFRDNSIPLKCQLKQTDEEGKCPISCPYRHCGKLVYEPALLHGILLLIGNLYTNREPVTLGTISKIPYTLDYLLEPYKNYRQC